MVQIQRDWWSSCHTALSNKSREAFAYGNVCACVRWYLCSCLCLIVHMCLCGYASNTSFIYKITSQLVFFGFIPTAAGGLQSLPHVVTTVRVLRAIHTLTPSAMQLSTPLLKLNKDVWSCKQVNFWTRGEAARNGRPVLKDVVTKRCI